jgi:putative transcriptional regulator
VRLREVRKARGLTQVQLAQRTGLDQATISRIERGRGGIDYDVLDRLCAALDCEPGEILVREPRGRRSKQRSR